MEIFAFPAAPRSHGTSLLISFQAIGGVLSARNPTSLKEESAINVVKISVMQSMTILSKGHMYVKTPASAVPRLIRLVS